ncbi:MAG: glycosyltransferase family 4 protein [Clostridium lundense]|nr:glycosyltransferase family 4 protein [Clostridium lundense]
MKSKRKKLLVNLRKLSVKPSGIGMYTYNFVNGMLEYDDFEIIGITDVMQSSEIKSLKQKGMKIIKYNKKVDKNFEVFKYFDFIEELIIKEQPDFFWEPNQIIPKNMKRKCPKTKIIVTIHDIFPITTPQFYSMKYRIYFKYFQKKTIKNADAIIYVSNFSKEETNNVFKESKNKPSFISYNIVNKPKFEHELKNNNYFLYIGNIEKRKGVHLLLDAYELYKKDGGDEGLKIAGAIRDKEIQNKLNVLINEYPNHVEYCGYIDEERKWKLLAECSAFVFPSFAEGFGIPPLEAMFMKKSVIISNIEIFREIFGNHVNYFNLDNYDNSINNVTKSLLYYNALSNESYNFIVNIYKNSLLIKKMIDFIHIL